MENKEIKVITKQELKKYTRLGFLSNGGTYFGDEPANVVLKNCINQLKNAVVRFDNIEFHSEFFIRSDNSRCYFKNKKCYLLDNILFIGNITEYKEESKIQFFGAFYKTA